MSGMESRPTPSNRVKKSKADAVPVRTGWRKRYVIEDKRNATPAILANVLLALREHPALSRCFARDDMAATTMLVKSLPGNKAEKLPRPVTEFDIAQVQELLQRDGLTRLSRETTHQAVEARAMESAFHPVRAYLNNLTWDGVERLNDWLPRYLGTKADEYEAVIGRLFLVSMVARIFEPGCQADYMLVLEGEQGKRKSTVCQILGDRWFSENLPPDVNCKDASQHIAGKWLIEIPEMSTFSRADCAALKAFMTRRFERYRPAYARIDVSQPRQCIFIGTTNKAEYFKDETGNRRFWPVACKRIDTDGLKRDRDMLFAEAVVRFKRREQWWPDPGFEQSVIQQEQDARFEADPWEELIATWIADHQRVTIQQVAREALSMEIAQIRMAESNRVRAVLMRLGWTKGKRGGSKGHRYWVRKSGESRTDALTALTDFSNRGQRVRAGEGSTERSVKSVSAVSRATTAPNRVRRLNGASLAEAEVLDD